MKAISDGNGLDLRPMSASRGPDTPQWIIPYLEILDDVSYLTSEELGRFHERDHHDWYDYYSSKLRLLFRDYKTYHAQRMAENYPYYSILLRTSRRVLSCELGIGAGTGVIELTRQGRHVVGIDIDPRMSPFTRRNAEDLQLGLGGDLELRTEDMFETTFAASRFGLTFNHGVLEHYDDRQIVNAITEALRISERLLFVVPTDLAADDRNRLALGLSVSGSEVALGRDSKAHFGDERYLPVSRWEELVARADAMVDSVFGYWIPEFRSKLVHPRNPATAYGRGMYAGYIVSRAP